jgi:hypothetical protein
MVRLQRLLQYCLAVINSGNPSAYRRDHPRGLSWSTEVAKPRVFEKAGCSTVDVAPKPARHKISSHHRTATQSPRGTLHCAHHASPADARQVDTDRVGLARVTDVG